MSCHQQHGTRIYIELIEAATGETITQPDWHRLRIDAAEDSGSRLTRSRAGDGDRQEAFDMLHESLQSEPDVDFERYVTVRSTQTAQLLDGIVVTSGTVEVVQYVARNGIRRSLEKARRSNDTTEPAIALDRFEVNDSYPYPQANSIPKIASSVDAIEAGADTDEALAISLGVSDRQGAYYGTALGYLGLAQETGDSPRTWGLTSEGAAFLNADAKDRVAILNHLYEQVAAKSMTTPDGESLSDATEERRDMALTSCQTYLDGDKAVEGVSLERDETRSRVDGAAEHARDQRQRAREASAPKTKYGTTCPNCFTVMSLSGVCDNCG